MEVISDLYDYIDRFKVEFESLRSALDRLALYVDRLLLDPLKGVVYLAIYEARSFCAEYSHELGSLTYRLSLLKRQLIYRGLFVVRKKGLAKKLGRAM